MATFCTKCGTELPADTQFCTACGAPQTPASQTAVTPAPTPVAYGQTDYQAVPPPPPPYAQQPYGQQQYGQPIPPPPPTGGSAVKIILIIVGVFVGLGILGACIFAFTIWRVSKAVHVETSGDTSSSSSSSPGSSGSNSKVSISTPGGKISVNSDQSYSAADLGTDVYPGATKHEGGMKMDLPTGSMVTSVFTTSDSKDKVLAFYKDKLGSEASTMDTAETAIVTLKKGENEAIMITITADKGDDNQTKISITHTKKAGN